MKQSKLAKSFIKVFTEREINTSSLDSYATLKRRLFDNASFFEVTTSTGEKKIISKRFVAEVGAIKNDPAVTIN